MTVDVKNTDWDELKEGLSNTPLQFMVWLSKNHTDLPGQHFPYGHIPSLDIGPTGFQDYVFKAMPYAKLEHSAVSGYGNGYMYTLLDYDKPVLYFTAKNGEPLTKCDKHGVSVGKALKVGDPVQWAGAGHIINGEVVDTDKERVQVDWILSVGKTDRQWAERSCVVKLVPA